MVRRALAPRQLGRFNTMDSSRRTVSCARHDPDGTAVTKTLVTPEMKLQSRSTVQRTAAKFAIVTVAIVILTVLVVQPQHRHSAWIKRLRHAPRQLTVFGVDDRHNVTNASSSPYSAVGYLDWNAEHKCTASLVGTKYALTAADCVLARDGTRRPSTLARPELVFAGAVTTAHVIKLHRQSEYWPQWTQETYVILELDVAIGETVGNLSLPSASQLDQSGGSTPVQMVGFDANIEKPVLQFAKCTCSFPATFNGPKYMLHHNCDSSVMGSPGSVLLVRYADMKTYIIGMHTNLVGDDAPIVETDKLIPDLGYNDKVANRGVLAPFIEQHLQALIQNQSMASTSTGSSTGSASSMLPPNTLPSASPQPHTSEPNVQNGSNDTRISHTAAYTCIGLVALAWVGILFIIVRHVRRPPRE